MKLFFSFGQISPVRFQCIVKKDVRPIFFKVCIYPLFDNLESGKINSCFGKSLEKVLNFGSKNLYESCIMYSPQGFSGIITTLVGGLIASETAFNAVYK